MVFKNALAFLLKNGLLGTHNPGVKLLLEALKLLYKVITECLLLAIYMLISNRMKLDAHNLLITFLTFNLWEIFSTAK